MAQHNVTFELPERELGKVDLVLKIKKDSKVLGELRISKGALEWRSKYKQKTYKLNWSKFADLIEAE